ncbi:hypothetical protein MTAT_07630 [Moorella thermoacetica]|uniref:Uncharacterized protein n=1 Tax=Neomoorella thermoacetica TaxID=1525 RepID=A0AAC9HHS9_NEOTH|nr:hypothetical protein [Moorella thermoacetica]AOQ24124.1 hypothetical protein Maut_01685 [Moorella thermoacetica]TYL14528.1 hypothetical protein MTAT_07630 [Moorella thermoacetica]
MDKERPDIQAIIEQFADALKNQGDIDLLVVSSDFAQMPLYRRYEVLGKALARVMQPIEPLACTPEEVQVEKPSKASFLYDVLARQKTVEYRL